MLGLRLHLDAPKVSESFIVLESEVDMNLPQGMQSCMDFGLVTSGCQPFCGSLQYTIAARGLSGLYFAILDQLRVMALTPCWYDSRLDNKTNTGRTFARGLGATPNRVIKSGPHDEGHAPLVKVKTPRSPLRSSLVAHLSQYPPTFA